MTDQPLEKLEFSNYDWQDWMDYWGLSLEKVKENWEKATDEERPKYLVANEEIQRQMAEKRAALASEKVRQEVWEAQQAERRKNKQAQIQQEVNSLFSNKSAVKDSHADKRADYSRQIMEKENNIDDLSAFENSCKGSNEHFLFNMRRPFEASEEAFYQRQEFPSPASQRQEIMLREAYSQLNIIANEETDNLEVFCRQRRRKMEDEIEGLYKERNSLPW